MIAFTDTSNYRLYWRNRVLSAMAFLKSNCLTPEARLNEEKWLKYYQDLEVEAALEEIGEGLPITSDYRIRRQP
jgi:hypothetical protein